MLRERFNINTINSEIKQILPENIVSDDHILKEINKYIDKVGPELERENLDWQCFSTFWPPRLVSAYQKDRLVCFFGAGLSIPSGLPSWNNLLTDYFGLDPALLSDDDLKTDPLTSAELASHLVGADHVQATMRKIMSSITFPSSTHLLTASLRLPFYITTNYDCLFERIWKRINPEIELCPVVNESDLTKYGDDLNLTKPNQNMAFLLKIHGSLDRHDEHLILTRSDYRYHYRANRTFFKVITDLLSKYHVLFIGFSHKDPEVTRLVEDVIYNYEKASIEYERPPQDPSLYSLQFSMRSHTPEIFAARGILALNPPITAPNVKDVRSLSLAQALSDLIGAADKNFHEELSLDKMLEESAEQLASELEEGLTQIAYYNDDAVSILTGESKSCEWLEELKETLGKMAGQGIYLLNKQGRIIELSVPNGLDKIERKSHKLFNNRPYFQQANTFRRPFISDSLKSVFNGFSTIFLCSPLMKNETFIGLLFSACQIGFWETPINISENVWSIDKDLSVILVDSNGVCLIPPNKEFPIESSNGANDKESFEANKGYKYDNLLRLSRRDKLISRVMQNVVPINQDDDVLSLTSDLKYYTVVTELKSTRWKLGISKPIMLSGR